MLLKLGSARALSQYDVTTVGRPDDGFIGAALETYGSFCGGRCQANMAHIRQSRPDSGLGIPVKVLEYFKLFTLCYTINVYARRMRV